VVDVIDFIQGTGNPVLFLILVFIYSILVAIILPVPIELVLLAPASTGNYGFYAIIALVIGGGKAIGSWLIFLLGIRIEDDIRRWSKRARWIERLVEWCITFVRKTRYLGLFIILSIPGMTDTIPIYIYSLFNEEGELLNMWLFVAVNFAAGIVRSCVMLALYIFLAISLFG